MRHKSDLSQNKSCQSITATIGQVPYMVNAHGANIKIHEIGQLKRNCKETKKETQNLKKKERRMTQKVQQAASAHGTSMVLQE